MYPFFCNFRKFRYLCISNRKARLSRASFRPDFRLQKSTTSPDGGIGRRAGLKHQWSNPCRFDPGSGYPTKCKCLIFKHLHFSFSFLHHGCTTEWAVLGSLNAKVDLHGKDQLRGYANIINYFFPFVLFGV